MNFEEKLEKARNIQDMFEIVKDMVWTYLKRDQAGIMVGLSDLGAFGSGFLGAFYSLDGNMIVINKRPLETIKVKNPKLYKPYLFHVILHEYIHSLGLFDENQTRILVYEASKQFFGENNIVTQMALSMDRFIPELTFPEQGFIEPENINIEFLPGIDKKGTSYIM